MIYEYRCSTTIAPKDTFYDVHSLRVCGKVTELLGGGGAKAIAVVRLAPGEYLKQKKETVKLELR